MRKFAIAALIAFASAIRVRDDCSCDPATDVYCNLDNCILGLAQAKDEDTVNDCSPNEDCNA